MPGPNGPVAPTAAVPVVPGAGTALRRAVPVWIARVVPALARARAPGARIAPRASGRAARTGPRASAPAGPARGPESRSRRVRCKRRRRVRRRPPRPGRNHRANPAHARNVKCGSRSQPGKSCPDGTCKCALLGPLLPRVTGCVAFDPNRANDCRLPTGDTGSPLFRLRRASAPLVDYAARPAAGGVQGSLAGISRPFPASSAAPRCGAICAQVWRRRRARVAPMASAQRP